MNTAFTIILYLFIAFVIFVFIMSILIFKEIRNKIKSIDPTKVKEISKEELTIREKIARVLKPKGGCCGKK